MRSKTGFNGPYLCKSKMGKVLQNWYSEEEKEKLKLNFLKALQKNPYLTKGQLMKDFYVGGYIVEKILLECTKEKLILKVGHKGKVVSRRGLEYLESNC